MPKETKEVVMVTVADLAEEFSVDAREIRVLLRANGFKAPEAEKQEGTFGPRAKYQWPEGSAEIKKIRELITSSLEDDGDEEEKKPAAPAPKAGKGKK